MSKLASIAVFIVGFLGYVALLFGLSYWSLPAAMVTGGCLAMWWSWYVSIGAQIQLRKLDKPKGAN